MPIKHSCIIDLTWYFMFISLTS